MPRFFCFVVLLALVAGNSYCFAQAKPEPSTAGNEYTTTFPLLGYVQPRNATEIAGSNWIIGCETLDRDYADYDAYKEYLVPLGVKRLRMQAGWAKTEKVKGVYDWAWLDHIINDATSRGLQPWLQLSYGNPLYPLGGGSNLGAGMPRSPEALAAWDKWVNAIVLRYRDRVKEWEIWNEPNFGDNVENTPEKGAALNIRTIKIIKKLQPQALVSGLSMGHFDMDYADRFFKALKKSRKLKLFDNMTYHDYVYNPDSNYPHVEEFRRILHTYHPGMKIRQGENGAPSVTGKGGAIGDHKWSELTQAKWDMRRMLGDLGHDVESSLFTIIDIAYNNTGPIKQLNVKGIIQSDSTKKVIRPKMAYYAMQHVTSIFDNTLQREKVVRPTYDTNSLKTATGIFYSRSTDRSFGVYAYKNAQSGKHLVTIWSDDAIPAESNATRALNFSFSNLNIEQPVLIDIISGKVFEIPAKQWSKTGNMITFKNMPIYDAPVVIGDKSLVRISATPGYKN